MKRRFPEVYQGKDKTHLPATEMPKSDFSTAAAVAKSGMTNPFGTAGKQVDSVLTPLAEGLEVRRQIIEVSSSEVHCQLDELAKAITAGADRQVLDEVLARVKTDYNMQEVVAQEVLVLPFAIVAARFLDVVKQEKKANQGSIIPSATTSQAKAAGIKIMVSPGSQKYLGSGSSTTRPASESQPDSAAKSKGAKQRRSASKKRKQQTAEDNRRNRAKEDDNKPPATGPATPGKGTSKVPGSKPTAHPNGQTPPSGGATGKQGDPRTPQPGSNKKKNKNKNNKGK